MEQKTIGTASYDPGDNKLRLRPFCRLDAETYARVKAAGFRWAPKQDLFVAPMWTPEREDLLIELAGEVGDEDTSLVERAEERADRFDDYRSSRLADASAAHKAVSAIADNIPFGQPILVGHHSERRARKDAERIQNGMRKAVKMWDTAQYWKSRAAGAIRHAKYKELPAVRARRIKTIEADERRVLKSKKHSEQCLRFWYGQMKLKDGQPFEVNYRNALYICNVLDHLSGKFPLEKYPRKNPGVSTYEGSMSLWSALGGSDGEEHAIITVDQARDLAIRAHERGVDHQNRWLQHFENRLTYERAMLGEQGGTVADRTRPEKGGACRCWASPQGGWSMIEKVNKVSVTVLDNWGNGGPNFTRTIPFDKLSAVMTKAEVDAARESGRIVARQDGAGFYLTKGDGETFVLPASRWHRPAAAAARADAEPKADAAPFDAMRDTLRNGGVQVVSAPQLFPTPPELAERVVRLAAIEDGHRVLEPSAGTGALADVIHGTTGVQVDAVEINNALCRRLNTLPSVGSVVEADFLDCNGDLGTFDRIVMNPPFANAIDIQHIRHARKFLKPGGRLVAICANGARQREQLMPEADGWIDLEPGSFKESGTNVNAAIVVMGPEEES